MRIDVLTSISPATSLGREVIHVVIVVLGILPERIGGVVDDGARIVLLARRLSWILGRAHSRGDSVER
jgi:hypothetical protein